MKRIERIHMLEKKLKYIKSVLKDTQDELFLLKVEEYKVKEKGQKAPYNSF